MGNGFGGVPTNGWNRYFYPDVTPGPNEKPSYDPNLGFPGRRKERVMIATEEQMRSAKLPLKKRDYCAHKLLQLLGCRKENAPFYIKCKHEVHGYLNCQYDDFILRMKEYERERRLRVREKECSTAQ